MNFQTPSPFYSGLQGFQQKNFLKENISPLSENLVTRLVYSSFKFSPQQNFCSTKTQRVSKKTHFGFFKLSSDKSNNKKLSISLIQ